MLQVLCFVNQKVAASVATVHRMELFCQARRGYWLPGLYSGTFKCQWQSRNRVNETESVGNPDWWVTHRQHLSGEVFSKPGYVFFQGLASLKVVSHFCFVA